MSKYTTEVRYICETAAGLDESKGYDDVDKIIEAARPKIFDFAYPIFDEAYKPILETKILRHYYTREIGFETVGLWKLRLCTIMNEIMPYYNQLYKSELLKFDPFKDADYFKKNDGTQIGNNSKTGHGTVDYNHHIDETRSGHNENDNWEFYSDTPQGNIYDFPGQDGSSEYDRNRMTYLTNATENTGKSDGNSDHHLDETNYGITDNTEKGDFKTTDDYLDHIWGKFPGRSYASLLKEFRETFLNIDVEIIKELRWLFLLLW